MNPLIFGVSSMPKCLGDVTVYVSPVFIPCLGYQNKIKYLIELRVGLLVLFTGYDLLCTIDYGHVSTILNRCS